MVWCRVGSLSMVSLLLSCDGEGEIEQLRGSDPSELGQAPVGLIGDTVELAQPCEWPSAVVLGAGGCSGVLIHPQVIMTAGHCIGGNGPAEVRFGETASTPARSVATTGCAKNPAANGVSVDDYAYCVLAEAVDMAIAPPLMGCELDTLELGQAFVTIGWGNGEGGGGIKRYAPSEFTGLVDGMIAASTTPSEACSGDSGGPTFIQLSDGSWRTVGVSSGGPAGQNDGCINPVFVVPAAAAAAWIEAETAIDITPCTLADGTWDPGPGCTGFTLEPELGSDWVGGTCDDPVSGAAGTCGPSLDQPEESDAPIVEITAPSDGSMFPGPMATIDVELLTDDGEGVAVVAVELFVDGQSAATDSVEWPIQAPASWTFDGAMFPEGEYTLTATGTDWWGNVGESAPVTFIVGDPSGDGDSGDGDGDSGDGDGDSADESSSDDGGGTDSGDDFGGDDLVDGGDGCACSSTTPRPLDLGWALLLVPLVALPRKRARRSGLGRGLDVLLGAALGGEDQ